MKPEITQKVKIAAHSSNTNPGELVSDPSITIRKQKSGLAKAASLVGSRRRITFSAVLGLAVSMGITTFPSSYLDTTATATESSAHLGAGAPMDSIPADSSSSDVYVDRLQKDVAAMQARHARKPAVLVAQAIGSRTYQPSLANRTDSNSLQFNGEPSVQIDVAQPRTRTYTKPVATAQPYDDGDLEDRTPNFGTSGTTIAFAWPAEGKLTSRFGRRWGRMHKGIDIAGPVGTPISAAADGNVIYAGWKSGYGNFVEIRHADGTTTRYGHNSRLSVSVGQSVRQGQQVAEMGSTGHSTGSHLHFEIRPGGGSAVNPMSHLPANG